MRRNVRKIFENSKHFRSALWREPTYGVQKTSTDKILQKTTAEMQPTAPPYGGDEGESLMQLCRRQSKILHKYAQKMSAIADSPSICRHLQNLMKFRWILKSSRIHLMLQKLARKLLRSICSILIHLRCKMLAISFAFAFWSESPKSREKAKAKGIANFSSTGAKSTAVPAFIMVLCELKARNI